jgi:gliding motility-associated peptidyl-prolyl isomerase
MKSKLFIITILLFVSCKKPIPRPPINEKPALKVSTSVKLNFKLKKEQENIFKNIIKKDSLHTYYTSKHGFWYKYDKIGKGNYFPKKGDKINYSIRIFDVQNHLIYDTQEKTYWVDKQDIINGLEVGLKLMKLNDEVTFLFPSNVAFGFSGDQHKIAVNQPIIIKVKLNKIKKNESN